MHCTISCPSGPGVVANDRVSSIFDGLESIGGTKAPPWADEDDSAIGMLTGSGRGAASAQPVDGC